MTMDDVNDLFCLLEIYRPGDKHIGDRKLRSAWLLVLEPFSRDEVRTAVADYFRECKFWPDVSDIAMRCPRTARGSPEQPGAGTRGAQFQPSLERIRKNGEWLDRFLDEHHLGWRERPRAEVEIGEAEEQEGAG